MRKYFLVFIFALFFAVKSFAAPPPTSDPNYSIIVELQIIQNQLTVIQNQLSSIASSGAIDWNKAISFIAGLMCASAFVISAGRRL